MTVMRGRFVNGRIETDGESYPDGTEVNFVVVPADEESYELTPEMEDDLEQSMAEIGRGEFITADQLLAELRARRERS